MNRSVFYARLRARNSGVFGTSLSQSQVSGMEAILNEAERRKTPLLHLAYMLATTYLETAHTMQPIHEIGKPAYFNRYDIAGNPAKAKELGNVLRGDGYRFRGRGFVQLTGRANYTRASKELTVDIVGNPDLALDPVIAAKIMFYGMTEGWFTGKALRNYLSNGSVDYVGARRIINGQDRANDIARYAKTFQGALEAAGYAKPSVPVTIDPPLAPKPTTVIPGPGTKPDVVLVDGPKANETSVIVVQTPENPSQSPSASPPKSNTGWAALIALVAAISAGIARYFGG